jgi:serine-type D-Ala-D-Ala carboxypeptidase/endopeptidase (penicillin-binding protein 4)
MLALLLLLIASAVARAADDPPDPRRIAAAAMPLHPALADLLDDPLFRNSDVAIQIVDTDTGDEVWAWDADRALVPASTMKAITSAAALKALGPSWRFHTDMLRDGDISAEGVLEGNLYVRGTGDPTLVVEKLWKMLQDLETEGVVEINGDVVLDDTWFSDGPLIPGWRKKLDIANGPAYFAPLGALSLNHNALSIVIAPAAVVGEPVRLQLETPTKLVTFDNQLTTIRAGGRGWVRIEREASPKAGTTLFTVEGEVPLDAELEHHYRAVAEPRAWFRSVLKDLLKAQGIKVNGKFRAGSTPADSEEILRLWSPPLHEILNHTNKYSSNFMAEHVLKALGAEVGGAPGTTEKGLEAVRAYLDTLGIPRDDYVIVNGSGLSRDTRLRPSQLNAVLLDMFHDPRVAPEFMSALSVSGRDGTLRRRFDDEDQSEHVRGKTGSLDGVYCLAGFFQSQAGDVYAVTMLTNRFRRSRPVRALHDKIGAAVISLNGTPTPVADPVAGAKVEP